METPNYIDLYHSLTSHLYSNLKINLLFCHILLASSLTLSSSLISIKAPHQLLISSTWQRFYLKKIKEIVCRKLFRSLAILYSFFFHAVLKSEFTIFPTQYNIGLSIYQISSRNAILHNILGRNNINFLYLYIE